MQIDSLGVAPTQAPEADAASTEAHPPIDFKTKVANLLAVIIPFAGLIAAIVLAWGVAFDWVHLGIMFVMYILTGLGITVGYHRYFTHKSFRTPLFMQHLLAILGSMAVQGPLARWVAVHRSHHQHSDSPGDPHSPHVHHHDDDHPRGVIGVLKGLWHAHVWWIMKSDPYGLQRYVPDLNRDRVAMLATKMFPIWALVGLAIPALLGGLITMTWTGALLGFLWGGLARICLVHHITWSVNSICHIWGTQPFRSHDHSRNNPLFAVLALGEGWHNNHHAFPASARHGLRWWEFDISYVVIRGLSMIGLASDIRVPAPDRIAQKKA